MAKAPQNTTRAAARQTLAPPALAPTAPSTARVMSDAVVTMGMIMPAGRGESGEQRHGGAGGKRRGRRQRGLHRARDRDLRDAELIARVGAERVLGHQLPCDLARQLGLDAALDVDSRQFLPLALDIVGRAPSARVRARPPRYRIASSPRRIRRRPWTSRRQRGRRCRPPERRYACRSRRRRRRSSSPSTGSRRWRRARRRAASRCGRPDDARDAGAGGSWRPQRPVYDFILT